MPFPSSTRLTDCIREEARRLGFFKIGVASAQLLTHGERLAKWLREGMHGEIGYLERQASQRLDPRLVLEGARSVLVPALHYYADAEIPHSSLRGNISRFAWGDDYHDIVRGRLETLLAFIKNLQPSARGLCYSDTGPVMEKAWGARTSIGWMGKNTTLISRDRGSWFFTGVVLLDIELEYDAAEEDYCGSCDRCIRACPSSAIAAPYVLDVRRCISHLTQKRGPIPRPLRSLMGNRIFGCDACQEACPWNRIPQETPERQFHPREENLMPELLPLAYLSADEFSERFRNSPVLYATRDGFVRNVVVAIGNSGKSEAVPALKIALQDASPLVRSHAAWALGQIADERVPGILKKARAGEADAAVLEEIDTALGARILPLNS